MKTSVDFTVNRIETFSDGVFAIVVTLLVFDLHFPHINNPTNENVWAAIVATLPKLLSWVNSFLIVCVIWMNHHRFMQQVKSFDFGLFWMNNLLLLFTSLLPFPTKLLGEYPGNNAATFFYGLCMFLPTIIFPSMGFYLVRHEHLLKGIPNQKILIKVARLRGFYGPVIYLIGAGLSWVNSWLAVGIYTIISIYFVFPRIKLTTD
ncbi:TMEM175 family protein [Mucilaginibacter galii]|uniref:TMEM175 family protein n=1 Tax=Mucilaginibacter galii TaxID=2005073 RepID=UPI0016679DFD|nr:TMEM175 family protein [Mucilaginibacter galii]